MNKMPLQSIAEILGAEKGTQFRCAVKVVRQEGGQILYVKDATGLAMKMDISEDFPASGHELFQPGACLLITGAVGNGSYKRILTAAEPLADEAKLKALEDVSIQRRRYDFDPTQYQMCNTRAFIEEYYDKRIHPDDVFGQTVARLFGKRIANDKVFASLLNHALSYVDWVHHEKKLLREFWAPGTEALFDALDDCNAWNRALNADAGVAREIEEAFSSEGWKYYDSPGYGFDADLSDVRPWSLPGWLESALLFDSSHDARSHNLNAGGSTFSGISEVPVFHDFEMAVFRAFGERIASDRGYAIHVWNALSETTWQDGNGRKLTYRSEAANLLVGWMTGNNDFQNTTDGWCEGKVLPEIEKAMKEQGWQWLEDIESWDDEETGAIKFNRDLVDLFGERMPRDKALCDDIWATITSAAWYNKHGESHGHFGGRGDSYSMAKWCCKGDYLDWYCCGEGDGVRQRIVDALKSRGWHMWKGPDSLSTRLFICQCNEMDQEKQ